MATNSTNGAYAAGRRDAIKGVKANPTGHRTDTYMKTYHRHLRKAQSLKSWPTGRCEVCQTEKDERDFEIYDMANDCFFCNDVCEANRNRDFSDERA
jgi:hypothetical protein